MEWQLPGGTAKDPVALIRGSSRDLACWSQRKTYHPGTGEGLEPDLRICLSTPGFHDVAILENKDRLSIKGAELDEILSRYVGGTCAQSIWVINYEEFPPAAEALSTRWPERSVHLASQFRPGLLDPRFVPELHAVFREALESGAFLEAATTPEADRQGTRVVELIPIEADLAWVGPPKDLDLHAWIVDSTGESHVYHADPGDLNARPYALLSSDVREGNDTESLKVVGAGVRSVLLAVHRYSQDGAFADAQATIAVRLGGGPPVQLRPPPGTDGWWHVMAIDLEHSRVDVLQHLADRPLY